MSKLWVIAILLLMVASMSGCATTKGYYDVQVSGPMSLPSGSEVDELWKSSKDGKSLIGIKGVRVLRVEIYGTSLDYAETEQQEKWTVFTLEKGQRFNFVFLSPEDGQYHYALVTEEDNEVPPRWMGRGIAVTKNYGRGSSMTAKEFIRR